MEFRTMVQALQIAGLVGVSVGFVMDVVFLAELNVVTLAVIIFVGYMTFTHNDLFWELVDKAKRKG
jgi:hypothetical protein